MEKYIEKTNYVNKTTSTSILISIYIYIFYDNNKKLNINILYNVLYINTKWNYKIQ
jgi:hypothetical protein